MIQRQQTLWLLLAAIASFLTFRFPFYTGTRMENEMITFAELDAASDFFFIILTGACLLISSITIFLYKDRKAQFKLTLTGSVLSLGLIILYFVRMGEFQTGQIALTSLFSIAILIGFVMASRGIYRDEKLVKSLDKLR